MILIIEREDCLASNGRRISGHQNIDRSRIYRSVQDSNPGATRRLLTTTATTSTTAAG
jgi:hypothetical protein